MKLLLVLVVCIVAVSATEFGPKGHGYVTAEAIKHLLYDYKLESSLKDWIGRLGKVLKSGLGVDIKTEKDSTFHWDCELIKESSTNYANHVAAMQKCFTFWQPGSGTDCSKEVTEFMHLAGDFFAHSNYLEIMRAKGATVSLAKDTPISDALWSELLQLVPHDLSMFPTQGYFMNARGWKVEVCPPTTVTCDHATKQFTPAGRTCLISGWFSTCLPAAMKAGKTPKEIDEMTPAGRCHHNWINKDDQYRIYNLIQGHGWKDGTSPDHILAVAYAAASAYKTLKMMETLPGVGKEKLINYLTGHNKVAMPPPKPTPPKVGADGKLIPTAISGPAVVKPTIGQKLKAALTPSPKKAAAPKKGKGKF